jgi:3-oxoacyl-[acyl-carrier protein] reductase
VALIRAAIPAMMQSHFGRIVLVSSMAAQVGMPNVPGYCAVKSALDGLARSIAIDFSRFGITANIVSPGVIDTESNRNPEGEPVRKKLLDAIVPRRFGHVDEVAETVAFLCSRASSYVNGATLPVTGGAHLAGMG